MGIKPFATVICAACAILSFACGGKGPVPEMEMVPGTALLLVHIEEGLNSRVRQLAAENLPQLELADSLLKAGPLGIALVGVDITSMEPQLLFLSDRVTGEYTAALAARQLDLDPRQEENRVDLVNAQGYARASVAERDGWTALYTGPAPHVTIGAWLELDGDQSLAADSALSAVIPREAHMTVLLPGNLFGFLALLPLERQIDWWQNYKDLTAELKPAALALGLTWPDEPGDTVEISAGMARRDGGRLELTFGAVDTGIFPDSVMTLTLEILGGMSL